MGDKYSPLFRCDFKDFEIAQACKTGVGGGLEIQARESVHRCKEDALIEVSVRLKMNLRGSLTLRGGSPSLLDLLIPHGVRVTRYLM